MFERDATIFGDFLAERVGAEDGNGSLQLADLDFSAMTRLSLRRRLWIHKWSSLLCIVFLLIICITGLPLVLRGEISDAMDDARPYASLSPDASKVSLSDTTL